MIKFLRAYLRSMRLYYSFITGIAGWIGVAYYEFLATTSTEHTIETIPPPEKKIVILLLLFLSWGINQIINDFLGLKEDRVNAPTRPMVTGELNPRAALLLSSLLLIASGVITWLYLERMALVFLVAGTLLNICYEYAKGHGILGNIVFGLMITMAPLFGGYAMGPTGQSAWMPHRISVLLMVWLINGLMTFYTYFKDYTGDKLAGKRTVVVQYGIEKSRVVAIVSAFLPTLLFLVLRLSGMHNTPLSSTFLILAALTVFLQIWTGVLYYRNPEGVKTYESLKVNFRACACGQATLIAIFNPDIALWLYIFSYIFVGFLFDLHDNPES